MRGVGGLQQLRVTTALQVEGQLACISHNPFKVSHSLHLGLSPAATSLPLPYFPFPTSTPPHPTTLLVIQGLLDSLRAGGVEARLVPFPALPEGATRTSLYSFWKVSLDVSTSFEP